jgi:hypothetical protein
MLVGRLCVHLYYAVIEEKREANIRETFSLSVDFEAFKPYLFCTDKGNADDFPLIWC